LARMASPRGRAADVRLASDAGELASLLTRWPGATAVIDEAAFGEPEVLEALIEDRPDTRFVLVVPRLVPDVLRYLEAGAAAILSEADALGTIATTVSTVDSDLCVITRPVLRLLLRHVHVGAQAGANRERLARLSPRELEIVEHLASGSDPARIAEALHVSVHTVRSHLKQIFRKLDVHSSVEAVVVAVSAGVAPGKPGDVTPSGQAHHG
ncbi:MAG TPA: LuxR C-terminal-related transcriptional regulator, partial [Acidimicrobiales bacterium]|nr:LuxR C-terminal-related transcriptional regulator [Acidimicrobiales bacterium]